MVQLNIYIDYQNFKVNLMSEGKLTGATFNLDGTATCHYSNGTSVTVPSSSTGYSSGDAVCPPSN